MHKRISVEPINNTHLAETMFALWQIQFNRFFSNNDLITYWTNHPTNLLDYLSEHAKANQGVIAKIDEEIVGYLLYDTFYFHGEESSFVPYIGNASTQENKEAIYFELYQKLAEEWVERGIKSHYFTISHDDLLLKNALFDLGFGSCVVDAFSDLTALNSAMHQGVVIEKAIMKDATKLYNLVNLTTAYYLSSPIFLRRNETSLEEVIEHIERNTIFLAKHNGNIVGFMFLSFTENDDIIEMTVKNCCKISGTYILEQYRNSNIGIQLLIEASNLHAKTEISSFHVDYETSNLFANKFWKKHFDPIMLSVKRTIHSDI